jgi:hypothetical protein
MAQSRNIHACRKQKEIPSRKWSKKFIIVWIIHGFPIKRSDLNLICMVMRSWNLIPNRPSHLEFNINHAATRKLFLFFLSIGMSLCIRYIINKGRKGILGHKWVIQLKELKVELTSNRLQHIEWRHFRRWRR